MSSGKQRTTLYLDSELMKKVKIKAVEENTSVSEIVERLLRDYLKSKPKR